MFLGGWRIGKRENREELDAKRRELELELEKGRLERAYAFRQRLREEAPWEKIGKEAAAALNRERMKESEWKDPRQEDEGLDAYLARRARERKRGVEEVVRQAIIGKTIFPAEAERLHAIIRFSTHNDPRCDEVAPDLNRPFHAWTEQATPPYIPTQEDHDAAVERGDVVPVEYEEPEQ